MTSTTGLRETLVEDGVLRSIAADPRGWHLTTRELASIAAELLERRTPSPNGSGEQVSEAADFDAVAARAWDFVRPKLVDLNREKGPAGVWSNGFRSGWANALSASMAGPVPEGMVKPLDSAPTGDDAEEPDEVHVHIGAWALVVGTNGKAAGWIDTHALFGPLLYRDQLLAPAPALPEAKPVADEEPVAWLVYVAFPPDGGAARYEIAEPDEDDAFPVYAKPVASPAEGEAAIWLEFNNRDGFTGLRRWTRDKAQAERWMAEEGSGRFESYYASADREAATREAVIEDEAAVEAVAKVIWYAFSARMGGDWPGMDSQLVAVIQCVETARASLRALAQQAKPQQEKP